MHDAGWVRSNMIFSYLQWQVLQCASGQQAKVKASSVGRMGCDVRSSVEVKLRCVEDCCLSAGHQKGYGKGDRKRAGIRRRREELAASPLAPRN